MRRRSGGGEVANSANLEVGGGGSAIGGGGAGGFDRGDSGVLRLTSGLAVEVQQYGLKSVAERREARIADGVTTRRGWTGGWRRQCFRPEIAGDEGEREAGGQAGGMKLKSGWRLVHDREFYISGR